ncbi:MAG: glutathione S-transferase family protein [Myxococcota bacterium]
MKLHDNTHAPNPRRVRVFLAEKGLEVPLVQVDIGNRENREPAFLALNPMGGVPVLELDDGRTIAESVAICRYFEETQPEPPLMGVGPEERALVEMWNRRMELELLRRIADGFRHTHEFFKGRITQVPEYGETCQSEVPAKLVWLDEALADRPFIAGDRFSIADITAMVGIDFGRVIGVKIDPELKNLARWHESVSARPSAKA